MADPVTLGIGIALVSSATAAAGTLQQRSAAKAQFQAQAIQIQNEKIARKSLRSEQGQQTIAVGEVIAAERPGGAASSPNLSAFLVNVAGDVAADLQAIELNSAARLANAAAEFKNASPSVFLSALPAGISGFSTGFKLGLLFKQNELLDKQLAQFRTG